MSKNRLAIRAVRAFVANNGHNTKVVERDDGGFIVYAHGVEGGLTLRPGAKSVKAELSGASYRTISTTRGAKSTVVGQAWELARDRHEMITRSDRAMEAQLRRRAEERGAVAFIDALGG